MSHAIPDTQSLAESLTADFNQSRDTERGEAIRELESFLAEVPAEAVFTPTRKAFYYGIATLVLAGALGFGLTITPNVGGGVMGLIALIAIFGLGLVVTHRNDGQTPVLKLTHTHLHNPLLPQPLPLAAVQDVTVWQTYSAEIHLDLAPGVSLPKLKFNRSPFMPIRTYVRERRNKPTLLVMTAPGFRVNGQKMDNDDVLELVTMYIHAAHAHEELKALHATA